MKAREDKAVLTEPRCPFCRELFRRPRDIETELGYFLGGLCSCGAVYACDPTGRNLGEAFVDALTYACGEDWSLAWSLSPDEDYEQRILSYNLELHTLSPKWSRFHRGASKGRLLFLRLKEGRGATAATGQDG